MGACPRHALTAHIEAHARNRAGHPLNMTFRHDVLLEPRGAWLAAKAGFPARA